MAGSDDEVLAMRRAFALACTPGVPLGPNPRVGAVILDSRGAVVGEGYHAGAGRRHAEVAAIAAAGHSARGGTAVVSLEPCNHVGRTTACTQALINAGVERVVFGQTDPNPVAAGGGAALAAAGVDVESGVLALDAESVNEIWSAAMRMRRPFVTWKLATTLDGRSAAADGSSRWITGAPARADVHRLRGICDAILVGTGTVDSDDPRLTVRDEHDVALPRRQQPLRVVMGTRLLGSAARVFDDAADTVVISTHDPASALGQLFARDRQHVWLEGGPTLAGAFLRVGLVDEVVAYVAPALLGAGVPGVTDLGIASIADILRFRLVEATRVGDDVRMTMRATATGTGSTRTHESAASNDKETTA